MDSSGQADRTIERKPKKVKAPKRDKDWDRGGPRKPMKVVSKGRFYSDVDEDEELLDEELDALLEAGDLDDLDDEIDDEIADSDDGEEHGADATERQPDDVGSK